MSSISPLSLAQIPSLFRCLCSWWMPDPTADLPRDLTPLPCALCRAWRPRVDRPYVCLQHALFYPFPPCTTFTTTTMGPTRKWMSTSSRVTMTLLDSSSMTVRTTRSSLTQIRQQRLLRADQERHAREKARHMQELLAEAQLEAGRENIDSVDFGENAFDTSDYVDVPDDDDTDEPVGGPLLSEFFKTFSQERQPGVYRRVDVRTRAQRHQRAYNAWKDQMPTLVDAYLAWKHNAPSDDGNTVAPNIFHVDIVGIADFERAVAIQQHTDELANTALLCAGLIGCSPLQPSIAIRIECLELYHQLRRRQSSLSIQAITKVLCTLHNVTYFRQRREQFSNAFDIYLQILGQQPDESTLLPARLHAMDGNFSAKRLDGSGSADPRIFWSRYFISEAQVDQFKADVQRHSGGRSVADSTTGACTENWTAAKSFEENKITVFDQTGIFLLACRHGIIEVVSEMKRSGELAKYGLAIVDRLLDVCGADQAIGHDIACSSRKTIASSSIGAKAAKLKLQVVVNAFHGFSHDRHCQLRNHPLYLNGLGLEDLETCKRIFASSNSAAVLIRHASPFHWMQYLDLHFDQWDVDRYTKLSAFLYNNYVQALQIIKTNTPLLDEFKRVQNITDLDFVNWRNEEYEYLSQVAMEPASDAVMVAYVEQLEKLRFAEENYGNATSIPFLTYTPANFTNTSGLNSNVHNTSKAFETDYASALHKYKLQLNVIENFEQRHGIRERWTPHHPDYVKAAQYSQERQFIRLVEELEGLVVRRLFEMSKANLAGTGYKMRKYISKVITRRSAAIRTALDRYNKLAPLQDPPRPILDYSEVVGYACLGEFSLLKHSRHQILTKPWSVSANHEMAAKYFKLVRSHEEIVRLNVEIKRLQSWVEHEDRSILNAIDSLLADDAEALLVAELKEFHAKRHCINTNHRKRLQKIYALEGYTGERVQTIVHSTVPDGDKDDGQDDEVNEEAVRLEDLVSHLTL
ncbi:hypothetical protein F4604DRAFT_1921540 [Suillus subluteus]|nr:hypothetical protein F4604DRAFT_1921540 [Suillus subluteus]